MGSFSSWLVSEIPDQNRSLADPARLLQCHMETVKWWSYLALIGSHKWHQGQKEDSPDSLGWVIVHNHKLGKFHGVWSFSVKIHLWLRVDKKTPTCAAFLVTMYKEIHPGIEISARNGSPDFSCQWEYRSLQESLHPVRNFTKLMLFLGCFDSSYLTAKTELWG